MKCFQVVGDDQEWLAEEPESVMSDSVRSQRLYWTYNL